MQWHPEECQSHQCHLQGTWWWLRPNVGGGGGSGVESDGGVLVGGGRGGGCDEECCFGVNLMLEVVVERSWCDLVRLRSRKAIEL